MAVESWDAYAKRRAFVTEHLRLWWMIIEFASQQVFARLSGAADPNSGGRWKEAKAKDHHFTVYRLATHELCAACAELLIMVTGEAEGKPFVEDDVELACGHHYHWSCFADAYSSSEATSESKKKCPSCNEIIVDPSSSKLLATVRNEGGVQEDVDLGALLDEEEIYDKTPELKKMRAFLEFCAEGDLDAVSDMLQDDPQLIAVHDFETGQTGLHVSVQNQREDIINLLLRSGADRNAVDIQGRNFYQYAQEMGANEEQLRRL